MAAKPKVVKIKPLNEVSQKDHLKQLPIQMYLSKIRIWLAGNSNHRICVVGSGTGSGKSTLVPQICAHTLLAKRLGGSHFSHINRSTTHAESEVESTQDLDNAFAAMALARPDDERFKRTPIPANTIKPHNYVPYDLVALNLDREENSLHSITFNNPKYPLVVITQPNNMASLAVAQYIARTFEERNVLNEVLEYDLNYGYIGHRVGLITDSVSLYNKDMAQIVVVTDKCLVNIMSRQPLLEGVEVIIVDEAHERSLYSDVIMSLSQLLIKRRTDCRVIISSATIAADRFLKFMYGQDTISPELDRDARYVMEGKNHEVLLCYDPIEPMDKNGSEEEYLRNVVIPKIFQRANTPFTQINPKTNMVGTHPQDKLFRSNDMLLFCRDKAQVVLCESIIQDLLKTDHVINIKNEPTTIYGYRIPYTAVETQQVTRYSQLVYQRDELKIALDTFNRLHASVTDLSTAVDISEDFSRLYNSDNSFDKDENIIQRFEEIETQIEDESGMGESLLVPNDNIEMSSMNDTEEIVEPATPMTTHMLQVKRYQTTIAHHRHLYEAKITTLEDSMAALRKDSPAVQSYLNPTIDRFVLQKDWALQKMYMGMAQQDINNISHTATTRASLRAAMSLLQRRFLAYRQKKAFDQWALLPVEKRGPQPVCDLDEVNKMNSFGAITTADIEHFNKLGRENKRYPARTLYIADNIAETSITLPEVTLVMDLGRAIIQRFDLHRRVTVNEEMFISEDRAKQRTGRCGRTRDGACVRLYKPEHLSGAHTIAEIQRVPLDKVVLLLTRMKLNPLTLRLVDPPKRALFLFAVDQLTKYQCIVKTAQFLADENEAKAAREQAMERSPTTANSTPTSFVETNRDITPEHTTDYMVTDKGTLFLNSPFDPDISEWLYSASTLDQNYTIHNSVNDVNSIRDATTNLIRTTHIYATNLALSHEIAMLTKHNPFKTTPADTITMIRVKVDQFRSENPDLFVLKKGKHEKMKNFEVIMHEGLLRCTYAQSDLIFIFFLYRLFLFYHEKTCHLYKNHIADQFLNDDTPSLEYLLVKNDRVQEEQHHFSNYTIYKQKQQYLAVQDHEGGVADDTARAEQHASIHAEDKLYCDCREKFCAAYGLELTSFATANESIVTTFKMLEEYDLYKIKHREKYPGKQLVSPEVLKAATNSSRQLVNTLQHLSKILTYSLYRALPHRVSVPLLPRQLVRGIVLAYPWIGKIKGMLSPGSAIDYFSMQSATLNDMIPISSLVSLYINQNGDEYRIDMAHPFIDQSLFDADMVEALRSNISKLTITNNGLVVAVGQKVWNYVEQKVRDKTAEDTQDQRRKYEELDAIGTNTGAPVAKTLDVRELQSYERELSLINQETPSLWVRFVGLDVRTTSLGCAVIIRNLNEYKDKCLDFINAQIKLAPAVTNPLFTKFILSGERLITVIIDNTFTVRVLEHYTTAIKRRNRSFNPNAVRHGYKQQSDYRTVMTNDIVTKNTQQSALKYIPDHQLTQTDDFRSTLGDFMFSCTPDFAVFTTAQHDNYFTQSCYYDKNGDYNLYLYKPHFPNSSIPATAAQLYEGHKFPRHVNRGKWLSAFAIKMFCQSKAAALLNNIDGDQMSDEAVCTDDSATRTFTLPCSIANEDEHDNILLTSNYINHVAFQFPAPSVTDLQKQIFLKHKRHYIHKITTNALQLSTKGLFDLISIPRQHLLSYYQEQTRFTDGFVPISQTTLPHSELAYTNHFQAIVHAMNDISHKMANLQQCLAGLQKQDVNAMLSDLQNDDLANVVIDLNIFSDEERAACEAELAGINATTPFEYKNNNLLEVVLYQHINQLINGIFHYMQRLNDPFDTQSATTDNNDTAMSMLNALNQVPIETRALFDHFPDCIDKFIRAVVDYSFGIIAVDATNIPAKTIFDKESQRHVDFIFPLTHTQISALKNHYDTAVANNAAYITSVTLKSPITNQHMLLTEMQIRYIVGLFFNINDASDVINSQSLSAFTTTYIDHVTAPTTEILQDPTSPSQQSQKLELSANKTYYLIRSLPILNAYSQYLTAATIPHSIAVHATYGIMFTNPSTPSLLNLNNHSVNEIGSHAIQNSPDNAGSKKNDYEPLVIANLHEVMDNTASLRQVLQQRVSLYQCLEQSLQESSSQTDAEKNDILSKWSHMLHNEYSPEHFRFSSAKSSGAAQTSLRNKMVINVEHTDMPADLLQLISAQASHGHKSSIDDLLSNKFKNLSESTRNRLSQNPAVFSTIEGEDKPQNQHLRLDVSMFDFESTYLRRFKQILQFSPQYTACSDVGNNTRVKDIQYALEFERSYPVRFQRLLDSAAATLKDIQNFGLTYFSNKFGHLQNPARFNAIISVLNEIRLPTSPQATAQLNAIAQKFLASTTIPLEDTISDPDIMTVLQSAGIPPSGQFDARCFNLIKMFYMASLVSKKASIFLEILKKLTMTYYFTNNIPDRVPLLPQFRHLPISLSSNFSLRHTRKFVIYHSELFELDSLLRNSIDSHNKSNAPVHIHDLITVKHHKSGGLIFSKFGLPSTSDVITTNNFYTTTTITVASSDPQSTANFVSIMKQQTRPTILQLGHKFSDFAYGVTKMFEVKQNGPSDIANHFHANVNAAGLPLIVGDLITCLYDSSSSSDIGNLDHTGAIYNTQGATDKVTKVMDSLYNNQSVTSNIIQSTGGGDVIFILHGEKGHVNKFIATLNEKVDGYVKLRVIHEALSPILLNSTSAMKHIEELIEDAKKDKVTIIFNRNDAYLQISHPDDPSKVKKYASSFEKLHESQGGFDARVISTCSQCGISKFADPTNPLINTQANVNQQAHMSVLPKCGHVLCSDCLFAYVKSQLSHWYTTPQYLARRNAYKLFTDIIYSLSQQTASNQTAGKQVPQISDSLQQHDLHMQAIIAYMNVIMNTTSQQQTAQSRQHNMAEIASDTFRMFNNNYINKSFILTCPHHHTNRASSKALRASLKEAPDLTSSGDEISVFDITPEYKSTCCSYNISLLELNSILPYTHWKQLLSYIVSEYFHPTALAQILNDSHHTYSSLDIPGLNIQFMSDAEKLKIEEHESEMTDLQPSRSLNSIADRTRSKTTNITSTTTTTTTASTNASSSSKLPASMNDGSDYEDELLQSDGDDENEDDESLLVHSLSSTQSEFTKFTQNYPQISLQARSAAFGTLSLSQYQLKKSYPTTSNSLGLFAAPEKESKTFKSVYTSTHLPNDFKSTQIELVDANNDDHAIYALNMNQHRAIYNQSLASSLAGSLVKYRWSTQTAETRARSFGNNPDISIDTPNHQADHTSSIEVQLEKYFSEQERLRKMQESDSSSQTINLRNMSLTQQGAERAAREKMQQSKEQQQLRKKLDNFHLSMTKYTPGERLAICLNSSCQHMSLFRPYYTLCTQCGVGSCNVCNVQNNPLHDLINDCNVFQYIMAFINGLKQCSKLLLAEMELAIEQADREKVMTKLSNQAEMDLFFYNRQMGYRHKIHDLIQRKTTEWLREDFKLQLVTTENNSFLAGKVTDDVPVLFNTNNVLANNNSFIRFCNGLIEYMSNQKQDKVKDQKDDKKRDKTDDDEKIKTEITRDPILNPPDLKVVLRLLENFFASSTPLFAYHGTSTVPAVQAILNDGLDPQRRSGQVYGIGEYVSKQMHVAQGFARGTDIVLVILALKYDNQHPGYCYVINNDITFASSFCLPVGYIHLKKEDEPVVKPSGGYEPRGQFPLPHNANVTNDQSLRYTDFLRWRWTIANGQEYVPRLKIRQLDAVARGLVEVTKLELIHDDSTFTNPRRAKMFSKAGRTAKKLEEKDFTAQQNTSLPAAVVAPPPNAGIAQWSFQDRTWKPYDNTSNNVVETAYVAWYIAGQTPGSAAIFSTTIGNHTYDIDFANMTQKNQTTQVVRALQRI